MNCIKIFTNSFINDLIYGEQIFTIIMSISDLQAELIGIISEAVVIHGEELKKNKERALEIIEELKLRDRLNDNIKYSGKEMTILGYVVYFDSAANGQRLSNEGLLELEEVIKNNGGGLLNIKSVNAAKRSIYAILPIGMLSFYSTAVFVIGSIKNSDTRIAACLSVLGLWLCVKLGKSIQQHKMVWREESNNIEKYKNLLEATRGFVAIHFIVMGLLVLASLAEFMIQYITGNNTQAVSSFFILGSLILIFAGAAALQIQNAIELIQISSEANYTGESTSIGQPVSSEANHTRGEGTSIQQLAVENFAQQVGQVSSPNN